MSRLRTAALLVGLLGTACERTHDDMGDFARDLGDVIRASRADVKAILSVTNDPTSIARGALACLDGYERFGPIVLPAVPLSHPMWFTARTIAACGEAVNRAYVKCVKLDREIRAGDPAAARVCALGCRDALAIQVARVDDIREIWRHAGIAIEAW